MHNTRCHGTDMSITVPCDTEGYYTASKKTFESRMCIFTSFEEISEDLPEVFEHVACMEKLEMNLVISLMINQMI
jgi:hypothetical protein